MLTREELKQRACAEIDRRRDEIIGVARQILENPEPGFSEYKTAQLVADKFDEMGIAYRRGLALTGIKGRVAGGSGPGPRVAVIGELDSLIVNEHPHADGETGAAHACGHHCQIGMMLGAIRGLTQPEVLSQLSGELVPFAVPAEEFIEVARRLQLREENKLEFMGGKQELIRLGEFDDVDLAMMCHTASDMGDHKFAVGGTSNGHVVKYVQFIGRGSHAGSAPHLGINALNAASFALQAIHSNREVFRGEDTVRVHGIMTKGGEAVNAVPADVRLEWRVRSATPQGGRQEFRTGGPMLQGRGPCSGGQGEDYQHPGLPSDEARHTPSGTLPAECPFRSGRESDHGYSRTAQPGRLYRHGRPEPPDASVPSLHRRGSGFRAQQGIPGYGL